MTNNDMPMELWVDAHITHTGYVCVNRWSTEPFKTPELLHHYREKYTRYTRPKPETIAISREDAEKIYKTMNNAVRWMHMKDKSFEYERMEKLLPILEAALGEKHG